jgi:hypothetical protein
VKEAKNKDKGFPQVTQKIIDKIMSKLEKPFLTAERFKKDMEEAERFFHEELERVTTECRLGLFIDYLHANGFITHQLSQDEHKTLLTISKEMVHGILTKGFALMVSELPDLAEIRTLVEKEPQLFLVYATTKETEAEIERLREENISIISNEEIVQFLIVLLLVRYFDEYLMTITAMPGLKDQVWSFLQTFGINYQMYKEISERWHQVTR